MIKTNIVSILNVTGLHSLHCTSTVYWRCYCIISAPMIYCSYSYRDWSRRAECDCWYKNERIQQL